jgi:hypothetical protein
MRVEFVLGKTDFASSGRGETAVPTKSLFRELARVALVHRLPVKFHRPMDEWHITKACCACAKLQKELAGSIRLRMCINPECPGRGLVVEGVDGGGGAGRGGLVVALDPSSPFFDSFDPLPVPRARALSPGAGPSHCPPKFSGKLRHRDVNAARNIWMLLALRRLGKVARGEAGAQLKPDGSVLRPSWLTPPPDYGLDVHYCAGC